MRPSTLVPLLGTLLLLLLAFAACSSKDETGPAETLKQFYGELNGGNYAAAVERYDSEARQVLDDPANAGSAGFGEWARAETRQGHVDRVEVLNEKSDGDTAELRYQVFYTDGSSKNSTVTLKRENGAWKLDLIR